MIDLKFSIPSKLTTYKIPKTMAIRFATAEAPVNIAVVKYWGKRDEDLILPINDSISVTLSKHEMCATTTVACSRTFDEDAMWLNGKKQDMDNPRIRNCIREVKSRVKGSCDIEFLQWPLHIASKNNFPTAAGLASSAAGFACLVKALGALYGVEDNLSGIARQGSGSACRSIFGGFVHWYMGKRPDGCDSIARQIVPKEHWPELRIIILVVNAEKKETSSTTGMKLSIETSSLLHFRASSLVPTQVQHITRAILEKDFHSFAEVTMKESNQFHAVCLDTYPPLRYLNSTSHKIMDFVHAYNSLFGRNKVAYTFDAGPNACLYLLDDDVAEILALVKYFFPPVHMSSNFIRGFSAPQSHVSQEVVGRMNLTSTPGAVQYVINTKVGGGPKIIEDARQFLLNERGLPI